MLSKDSRFICLIGYKICLAITLFPSFPKTSLQTSSIHGRFVSDGEDFHHLFFTIISMEVGDLKRGKMDALGFEKCIKFFEHTVNGIILSAI